MTINQLCTLGICSHPPGTHAWNAIQGENNHLIPHDPHSSTRTDAWLHHMHSEHMKWMAMCVQLGIKHWSER